MDRLMRYCEDDEEAIRLLKEELPAAGHRGNPTGANQHTKEGEGERKGNNITFPSDRGTKASYTLSRLKRDHPEIAKEVIDGNLSANAGAIKAGFRTRKVQVELSPEGFQRAVQRHLPDWRLVKAEEVR